jgi:hypothetical protein
MIKKRLSAWWAVPAMAGSLLALFVWTQPANAINQIPPPDPQTGSYGLEATKTQAPPTTAATITTPGNGGSFSTSPITVSGICTDGLLVQIYDNSVLVGSVMCAGGSFSLQVSLFNGVNELSAIQYDDLEQPGPVSNLATVNYSDSHLAAFGSLITLTSAYGRRSAAANAQLTWPLQLSGGTGPYAFSIDWGDGSSAELKSQSLAGLVTIDHTFKNAGIYTLNVKVTDVNGVSAFLQVVGVASGTPPATQSTTTKTNTVTKILWIPAAVALGLIIPAYIVGRRSEVVSLRNRMLKERNDEKNA